MKGESQRLSPFIDASKIQRYSHLKQKRELPKQLPFLVKEAVRR